MYLTKESKYSETLLNKNNKCLFVYIYIYIYIYIDIYIYKINEQKKLLIGHIITCE